MSTPSPHTSTTVRERGDPSEGRDRLGERVGRVVDLNLGQRR